LSAPDHDPSKKYEFGVLISFKYPIQNSGNLILIKDEFIVVATTRLETMLGDTAIAVHPTDVRYKHLVGKFAVHPFQQRLIPIVADEYPDPLFGSGAVKITPAHDFNDYVVGKRQNLDFINIFTDDGKVNENGYPFTGLQRFDAREAVLKALQEKGLYLKTEPNKMVLPLCGRSGNIVEPLMKPQWWVDCQDMAKEAANAVKDGRISIVPASSEKEWFRWLENIQDWCISRQLWWGHRVPAYLVKIDGVPALSSNNEQVWVVGRDLQEATSRAASLYVDIDSSRLSLHQGPSILSFRRRCP
jgi:valyl-tRNA synthetase